MLQQLIQAVIGAVVPFLYQILTTQFPEFPLAQADILNLLLWAVGFAFAAWKANNALRIYQIETQDSVKIGGKSYKVSG